MSNKETFHSQETVEREKQIDELLSRGVSEVIGEEILRTRLLAGDNLRVKFGTDPTSPNIHIGRMVPLLKLRDFQDLGCTPVIVIGNFTAEIGDTSDKESERPMLTPDKVMENMVTYMDQMGKIIDMEKAEIHFNADWLAQLSITDFIRMADLFSLAEFMNRSNVKPRLEDGKRVSLRELLYPLMQGYDSVAIQADVELGGSDQRFNLLAGRTLQESFGQSPQSLLMTNLIRGMDGRKMSSSWGNTVNILDHPNDFFGKLMKMRDEVIIEMFVHCTRIPTENIEAYRNQIESNGINPMEVKLMLARAMTGLVHGDDHAEDAHNHFRNTIQQKETPDEMAVCDVTNTGLLEILIESGLVKSKSEGRRLIQQKGIRVNGEVIAEENSNVPNGAHLQKGKHMNIRVQYKL